MERVKNIKLNTAVFYSKQRIECGKLVPGNYIGTDNLLQNKMGKTDALYAPTEGKTTRFNEGDILIANIRPYLKKIWYATCDGGSSADVLTLQVKKEFDSRFVYYSVLRDDFFTHVMNGSKGTKMPRGDKDQILDFLIPNFPYDKQKLVSETLSALDKKIELNNRIVMQLENMSKALYDHWFVQFEFPDKNNKPYKASGGELVYNKQLGRHIPKEWKISSMSELIDLQKGVSYTTAEITEGKGIPMLNLGSIDVDKSYREEKLKFSTGSYGKKNKVFPGDLLLACTDMTRNADIIGCPISVPSTHKEFIYSMDLAKINFKSSDVLNSYIYMVLRTDWYHKYIKKFASGTNVLHLDVNGLMRYTEVIPPMPIQEKFESLVKPTREKISASLVENLELIELRNWLLPLLLNEQVSVI